MRECDKCGNLVSNMYFKVNHVIENGRKRLYACPECSPAGYSRTSADDTTGSRQYDEEDYGG